VLQTGLPARLGKRAFTYGELARSIGEPDGARAVGVALARKPFPIIVPCHRVVAASGKIGGFPGRVAAGKSWHCSIPSG